VSVDIASSFLSGKSNAPLVPDVNDCPTEGMEFVTSLPHSETITRGLAIGSAAGARLSSLEKLPAMRFESAITLRRGHQRETKPLGRLKGTL
jgi:hypothetical protein